MNWVVAEALAVVNARSNRPDSGSVVVTISTETRPKLYRNYITPLNYEVDVFDCTTNNFVSGLHSRVYLQRPEPNPCAFTYLKTFLEQSARKIRFHPLSREDLIDRWACFSKAKRERYIKSLDEDATGKVSAFVKWEYVKSKGKPRPRIIQFRDAAFLSQMDSWYTPLEKACSHTPYLFHPYDPYVIAKGFNHRQRMSHIVTKIDSLRDPYVINGDGHAFDAHQGPESISVEWSFYKVACLANGVRDVKFNWMRNRQTNNSCFARLKDGTVRYRVSGNRMSGDRNTGMGNSILTVSYLSWALHDVDPTNYRFYVDGDDFILFVSACVKDHVMANLSNRFKDCCQDLDVMGCNQLLHGLEPIEFCQSRPVMVRNRWVLVRDPLRVINNYCRSHRWFSKGDLARRYFATIATPELAYNSGVPVLSSFFRRLRMDVKTLPSELRRWWIRSAPVFSNSDVDESSRLSFEKAFGIDVATQLFLESWFSSWDPDFNYSGYKKNDYETN